MVWWIYITFMFIEFVVYCLQICWSMAMYFFNVQEDRCSLDDCRLSVLLTYSYVKEKL